MELLKHCDLEAYLASVEREVIMDALMTRRWNRTRAARDLGITFRAIRYRMERLGIEQNGSSVPRAVPDGYDKLWPALRTAAFKAFGAVCAKCGATRRLHVDHIRPIARFPELALDLSNLQILCATCNVRKGIAIPEDQA